MVGLPRDGHLPHAGDKVEAAQGSGTTVPTNAAQFTFYEYTPATISYTLTSVKQNAPTYTVTWKNEDGTVLETDTDVAQGTTPSYDGETPTKAADIEHTYTFDGWSPEIAAVTGNVTYTATFKSAPRKYTIKFVNEDGTVLQSGEVAYGETPAYTGETPTKAAAADGTTYTFKAWSPAITGVTKDAAYTATYEAHAPAAQTVKLSVTNYTKGGATVTVNGVSETDKEVSFDVNANASVTVYVSASKACAVGLQNADGTYTRLKATKSGNVYNYTVSTGSANATLVVGYKGDFNANGSLQAVDATLTAKTVAKLYSANELQKFLGDTNGNGTLQAVDATLTAKTVAKLYTPVWDIKK